MIEAVLTPMMNANRNEKAALDAELLDKAAS
jgi:hypothetical protein